MVGAAGFEPATLWSQTRCATRLRYAPKSLNKSYRCGLTYTVTPTPSSWAPCVVRREPAAILPARRNSSGRETLDNRTPPADAHPREAPGRKPPNRNPIAPAFAPTDLGRGRSRARRCGHCRLCPHFDVDAGADRGSDSNRRRRTGARYQGRVALQRHLRLPAARRQIDADCSGRSGCTTSSRSSIRTTSWSCRSSTPSRWWRAPSPTRRP